MIQIELPFPAKILWPNGRGHHMAKHRAFQMHKEWAHLSLRAAMGPPPPENLPERLDWSVTFYPKTRHAVDDDNARSSLKAYQDGLAAALRINDSRFNAPTVRFAEPVRNGRVVISIGEG